MAKIKDKAMRGRPEFIPGHAFREYRSAYSMSKLFSINGAQGASFISKRKLEERPIRNIAGKYRALDVIAAARADSLDIQPPVIVQKAQTVAELNEEIKQLTASVESLKSDVDFLEEPHKAVALNELSLSISNQRLLRPHEIVKASKKLKGNCGVYFLVDGEEVVYVGQSVNVAMRVSAHFNDKKFDSACFVLCEKHELDVVESMYIHLLEPKYNGGLNSVSDPEGNRKLAPISYRKLIRRMSEEGGNN